MKSIVDSKGVLARLMASENITVQHRNVRTAMFDGKRRVLICPLWKDMTSEIYDLLMGHEVGHALFTPPEGWHDTLADVVNVKDLIKSYRNMNRNDKAVLKKFKHFLNVIEDCRIEKLIKRKYPGLRRPFLDAYKNLFDRDLFNIKKLKGDYSRLNLIDRLNIHFKLGAQAFVKFSKVEQQYVVRTENLETWDEVVVLTHDIYKYVKENEQNKIQNDADLQNALEQMKQDEKKKKEDKKQDKKPEQNKQENEEQDQQDEAGEDEQSGEGESNEEQDGDSDESGESGDEGSESDDQSDDSDEIESGAGESEASDESSDEDESDEADGSGSGEEESDKDGESSDDDQQAAPGSDGSTGSDEVTKSNVEEKDVDSITDTAFRDNEDKLIDHGQKAIFYMEFPKANLDYIIIKNDVVIKEFKKDATNILNRMGTNHDLAEIAAKLNNGFMKRNKQYIASLIKEFEMRKNATAYARQLVSKTGELDTRKLERYRFTSDLFKKVTNTTKGKSHGMVMFLDMSASMESINKPTIEQLLILAVFCKKVNIPFDVYGFTDGCRYERDRGVRNFTVSKDRYTSEFDLTDQSFHLKHLISSELGTRQFRDAFNMLLIFGGYRYSYFNNTKFHMGGTPFMETLVASKTIIEKFKIKTHVDIVNVVYLTDGHGSNSIQPPMECISAGANWGFVDQKTKHRKIVDMSNVQASLTEFVRELTGCRHIGFFLGTNLNNEINRRFNSEKSKVTELQKSLHKNGWCSASSLGYDNYYFINSKNIDDSEMQVHASMSDSVKLEAFNNHMNKKSNDRAILKQFANEIANNL